MTSFKNSTKSSNKSRRVGGACSKGDTNKPHSKYRRKQLRYNRTVYDSALLKYKVLGKDVHLIKDNKEEATNIWDMAKSIRVGNAGTKQGVVARIMELEERDNDVVHLRGGVLEEG